jgi:putative ABC transport system substrate-binding protein
MSPPPSSFPQGGQLATFVNALKEYGYVDGETARLEIRGGEGRPERFSEIAAELAALPVDVILTWGGTPAALAAKEATSTIPIVAGQVGDPVGNGLVASIPRPGGNVTALTNVSPESASKRLELLKELVPGLRRVDALSDFSNPAVPPEWNTLQAAANQLGVTLRRRPYRDLPELEAAFREVARDPPDAMILAGDPVVFRHQQRVAELCMASGLPVMHGARELVVAGGLMSFGPNFNDIARSAADYVAKILRGTPPGDLPVRGPSTFVFALNLTTAEAMGLSIPQRVLDQVTETIR